MASKRKKRYSPDPKLGTVPTGGSNVQIPTARGAGAARPTQAQPLNELGASLSRFNKALVGYQMGKYEKGMEEAHQYTEGMSAEISAKSYGFRRFLKKMGFSQWRNPWIYSKQIISVAENQAHKDFGNLMTDKDFLNDLRGIKENAGNDYEKQAGKLFDEARAEKFSREAEFKKEGAYWDIGYGDAWEKEKNKAVKAGLLLATEYKHLKLRRAFFEGGRDQLYQAFKDGNLKGFRKHISEGFNTVPFNDNLSASIAVLKNIIVPVFEEKIEQGGDLDEIAKQFKKVTTMSRDVTNEQGERTGGVRLFKDTGADIDPSDQSYLSIQGIWRGLEDKYEKAAGDHFRSVASNQGEIFNKVKADLRSLQSFKEQHHDKFEKHGLLDLQFPFDTANPSVLRKVASVFAEVYADDVDKLAGVDAEDQRIFFEVFQQINIAANSDVVTGEKNSVNANAAFKRETSRIVGEWLEMKHLAPDILDTIHKSILKGKAGAGKRYPKEWLDEMGAAGIRDLFYHDHPDIKMGATAWAAAVDRYFDPIISGAIQQTAHHQLQVIQGKYKNHNTDEDDLHILMALKQDLVGSQSEAATSLRTEIDKMASRVAIRNNNAPMFKEVNEATYRSGIVDMAFADFRAGISGKEFATIDALANETVKFLDGSGDWNNSVPPLLRDAAKEAVSWFKNDFYDQQADAAMSATLDQVDPNINKETWWASKGLALYKKDLSDRLIAGRELLLQRYRDNSEFARALKDSGTARQKTEQTFLTPEDTGRVTKLNQIVDELQGFWNSKDMSSDMAVKNTTAGRDHPMLENFFAGPKGNKFWREVKAVNAAAKEAFEDKLSTYVSAANDLKLAEAGDVKFWQSQEKMIKQANENLTAARMAVKDHVKAFQVIPWEELVDNNFNLSVDNAFGEPIKIKMTASDLNLNEVLIFDNLEDIGGITEEWNTLTDGLKPTKDKEETLLDPTKASEKLQKVAGIIKVVHGIDILHPAYKQRSKAEEVLEGLWAKQSNMLMAKFPERVPSEVYKGLEHRALENFINSDRTKFQNEDITKADKTWVSGVFRQRRDILDGKYNVKAGITYEQFIKLYRQSLGNTLPMSGHSYLTKRQSWTPTREKWYNDNISLRRDGKNLPREKRYVKFKDSVRMSISDEIARGSMGVPNPHDRSKEANRVDTMQSRSGKYGEEWTWGLHKAQQKYSGILERAAQYPESPSPELAEAYNDLVISLGSQRYLRPESNDLVPNRWGITPMLIPPTPPLPTVMDDPTPDKPQEEEKPFSVDSYLKPTDKK